MISFNTSGDNTCSQPAKPNSIRSVMGTLTPWTMLPLTSALTSISGLQRLSCNAATRKARQPPIILRSATSSSSMNSCPWHSTMKIRGLRSAELHVDWQRETGCVPPLSQPRACPPQRGRCLRRGAQMALRRLTVCRQHLRGSRGRRCAELHSRAARRTEG